jgi:hypothetical protein
MDEQAIVELKNATYHTRINAEPIPWSGCLDTRTAIPTCEPYAAFLEARNGRCAYVPGIGFARAYCRPARRAARWADRLRRSGTALPSNDARLWEILRCWWAVRLGSLHILHQIERRYAADETWYVQYCLMMTHTASRDVPSEKRSHTIGA